MPAGRPRARSAIATVGAGAGTWSVDEWKTKSDTRLAPGFGS